MGISGIFILSALIIISLVAIIAIPSETFSEWNNHTLVFLKCEDIEKEYFKLQKRDITCVPFFEPDYDDRLTAVCVYMNEKHMNTYSLM